MNCTDFASNTVVCSNLHASLTDEINVIGICPSEICDDRLAKYVDTKLSPPPPPQPHFRSSSSADREGACEDRFSVEEGRDRILVYIRNCKVAVGLEIQQSEPALWTCDCSGMQQYALLAAELILPTPSQRNDVPA